MRTAGPEGATFTETNAEQLFEKFRTECLKWVDAFGLHHIWWNIQNDAMILDERWAETLYDHEARAANIGINVDVYDQENAEQLIEWLAFHEVCETMLLEIQLYKTVEENGANRHSIVHHIAKAIGVKNTGITGASL